MITNKILIEEVYSPKWTMATLKVVLLGVNSFNRIKDKLPGITPKLLSLRLKELLNLGLVEAVVDDSVRPIRYSYNITNNGKEAINRLSKLGLMED